MMGPLVTSLGEYLYMIKVPCFAEYWLLVLRM